MRAHIPVCFIGAVYFLLAAVKPAVMAEQNVQEPAFPPVTIDYFYEAGCPECNHVRDEILPQLEKRFPRLYVLNRYDIFNKTNYLILVQYHERLHITKNEPVSMVVDYRYFFNGLTEMRTGLFARVDACIEERLAPDWTPPPFSINHTAANAVTLLEKRMGRFTIPAVGVAGLLDGMNPCAIGTLVFFMSLLVVSGIRGARLIAVGISFCLASFVTYTAIGFGLLHGLKVLQGYRYTQQGIDWVMVAALAVLAFLSFRDAYRFKQTGRAGDVVLQLPGRIKQRIHSIMRSGLKFGNLLVGGLFIGLLVTVLESICTGQVYLPTLVAVIKSGHSGASAWSYLLLYNAMFIMPLVAVLILACFGLKTETLLNWSRRNVVPSKILLGLLFVALAVLILVM